MHIDPPFSFDNFSFVGEFGVSWEFKDPERWCFKKQILPSIGEYIVIWHNYKLQNDDHAKSYG